MNHFVVSPVIKSHKRLYGIIGEDWIPTQVESVRSALKQKASLHPSRMTPAFGWGTHPLVSEAKDGTIPRNTTLMDSLEIDLCDLATTKLPCNLSERLKSDHDCRKVAYELRIAAGFCRLGYRIAWIPPSSQRQPEFTVDLSESNRLSVECKKRDSLDGYEQEGGRFWKHLQFTLTKKMQELSLNYWVKITGREFNLNDIDSLISEIISALQSNEYGQFNSTMGNYIIDYTKLANPGKSITMDIVNMFPRGGRGINIGKQNPNQIMKGPLTDPILLRLEIIDDLEHRTKGIVRNLKIAAHQVIKGFPNLVYLDVNIPDYQTEQSEFGVFVAAVKSELSQRHRQISAVVVTNIYPSLSLDECLGWRVRTELIEHPNPIVKLPRGFKFPGDNYDTQWLPGNPSVRV